MDNLIATVTDAGVEILNNELFDSIRKFSLVDTEDESYYTDDIHSLMFDENGVLTATIVIPKEDNFDRWNKSVVLQTVDLEVVCIIETPQIKFLSGIGGVQEVKISVSGTPSEIVFKADDYVTMGEIDNIFAKKDAVNPFLVPKGLISMWSGLISAIPTGWFLCNGTNNTPDLRNRFIYGASVDADVGATGGSKDAVVVSHNHGASSNSTGSHTHTANHSHTASSNSTGSHTHTANHNHSASSNTTGNHSHSINATTFAGYGGGGHGGLASSTTIGTAGLMSSGNIANSAGNHSHTITVNTKNFSTGSAGNHSHTITVNNSGVSGVDKNLPPYMKLAYIMKG